MSGEVVLDFAVSGYRLRNLRSGVAIPVVPPPMTDELAPHVLEPLDKLSALHATSNSATRRAFGMWSPLKSV